MLPINFEPLYCVFENKPNYSHKFSFRTIVSSRFEEYFSWIFVSISSTVSEQFSRIMWLKVTETSASLALKSNWGTDWPRTSTKSYLLGTSTVILAVIDFVVKVLILIVTWECFHQIISRLSSFSNTNGGE